jgi:hypothetical protein
MQIICKYTFFLKGVNFLFDFNVIINIIFSVVKWGGNMSNNKPTAYHPPKHGGHNRSGFAKAGKKTN